MDFKCYNCDRIYDIQTTKTHCVCGGYFVLDYRPSKYIINHDERGMYKYASMLPFIEDIDKFDTNSPGSTTCVTYDDELVLMWEDGPHYRTEDRGVNFVNTVFKQSGILEEKHKLDMNEYGIYNPLFYEGIKTYVYEIYESIPGLRCNIFIPLKDGMMFLGVIKGIEELIHLNILDKSPNIILVQYEKGMQVMCNNKEEYHKVGIEREKQICDLIRKHSVEVYTASASEVLEAQSKYGDYDEENIYKLSLLSAYVNLKKQGLKGICILPDCRLHKI